MLYNPELHIAPYFSILIIIITIIIIYISKLSKKCYSQTIHYLIIGAETS